MSGLGGDLEVLEVGRDVLLFFGELYGRPKTAAELVRQVGRPVYQRAFRRQRTTGFHVAYHNLARSLRNAGYRVHEDRQDLALANPTYPVGLGGYPRAIPEYSLPNPTILGPGMYDHPALAPHLMDDPRFRRYIVPCQWMMDLFAPLYGADRCMLWFAGIDSDAWPSLKSHHKDLDVVVYDKIRWARDHYVPAILDPVTEGLREAGCTFEVLRYGQHDQAAYRTMLARARGLVFVCEHETQGLAYQEALSSDVPVLAWDNGFWLDPLRERYSSVPVPASSVPFFSPECGERFADASGFASALTRFRSGLASNAFAPRAYVQRELRLDDSARRYADAYFGLCS